MPRLYRSVRSSGAAAVVVLALSASSAAAASGPTSWQAAFENDTPSVFNDQRSDSFWYDWNDGDSPTVPLIGRVERAGARIAEDKSANKNGVWIPLPELLPGDLAVVTTTDGTVVFSSAYDGTPSFDPTTCVGVTGFSGKRTPDAQVSEVKSFGWKMEDWGYGNTGWSSTDKDPGIVTTLAGDVFGGSFSRPLTADRWLYATSKKVLSPALTIEQTQIRPVPACPPPPVPADTTAPNGSATALTKKQLKKLTMGRLFSKGLVLTVTSSEPATLTGQLSLRKSKKKKPTSLGTVTQPMPGGVPTGVVLKPAKKHKKKLKGLPSSARLVVNLSLKDAAGNSTPLPPVTLKIPKP